LFIDSLTFSLRDIETTDKSLFFLTNDEQVLNGDDFKEPYKKINLKTHSKLHIRYIFENNVSLPENTQLKISFTLLKNTKMVKRYSLSIDLKKISRLERVKPTVC
jgi:hypothetical protein